jgi:transcriptional regulator with XRE-family HTH domain
MPKKPFKLKKMDIKKYFGQNLKHYRKKLRFSQELLSEKVNISVMHLSKIERGLTFVSAELLERLAENLNISAAHLFCNSNQKIYDDDVIADFDRILGKHLFKAIEGIKTDFIHET